MESDLDYRPENEVHRRRSLSTTGLCDLYGVARKTGYKWIAAHA
jgi:hypothetical protein